MKILVFGGTGFIGSTLVRELVSAGNECIIPTRRKQVAQQKGVTYFPWDGNQITDLVKSCDSADAIINLAGETIGKWPWSKEHKERVLTSRVRLGEQITSIFTKPGSLSEKKRVYIQSSGVGYYGDNAIDHIDEKAKPGDDFLARVAVAWEESTAELDRVPSVRRCVIRTSLVLGKNAGALPMMALPVQLFVGGPLGNGRQGVSWIHIDDEVGAILHLLNNAECEGVFNLSAPQPVSNAQFMKVLGRVLGRPSWLPAPAFALHIGLGEMSDLLLKGQYAWPQALLGSGYKFKYAKLEDALNNIYKK